MDMTRPGKASHVQLLQTRHLPAWILLTGSSRFLSGSMWVLDGRLHRLFWLESARDGRMKPLHRRKVIDVDLGAGEGN